MKAGAKNPYFGSAENAVYELVGLLPKLTQHPGMLTKGGIEDPQLLEAIGMHAGNICESMLAGIEAANGILSTVMRNDEMAGEVSRYIANFAWLLRTSTNLLATMRELEHGAEFAMRLGTDGGDHA